jgi:hypothetical protein
LSHGCRCPPRLCVGKTRKVRSNMVRELRCILLALIAGALCWASVGLLLWAWLG